MQQNLNLFCCGIYLSKFWVVTKFNKSKIAVLTNGYLTLGNSDSFGLHQLIDIGHELSLDGDINCLTWCDDSSSIINSKESTTGYFACGYATKVVLFAPQTSSRATLYWINLLSFDCKFRISAFCFSPGRRYLLCGNRRLKLYELSSTQESKSISNTRNMRRRSSVLSAHRKIASKKTKEHKAEETSAVSNLQESLLWCSPTSSSTLKQCCFSTDTRLFFSLCERSNCIKAWYSIGDKTLRRDFRSLKLLEKEQVLSFEIMPRQDMTSSILEQVIIVLGISNKIYFYKEVDFNSETFGFDLVFTKSFDFELISCKFARLVLTYEGIVMKHDHQVLQPFTQSQTVENIFQGHCHGKNFSYLDCNNHYHFVPLRVRNSQKKYSHINWLLLFDATFSSYTIKFDLDNLALRFRLKNKKSDYIHTPQIRLTSPEKLGEIELNFEPGQVNSLTSYSEAHSLGPCKASRCIDSPSHTIKASRAGFFVYPMVLVIVDYDSSARYDAEEFAHQYVANNAGSLTKMSVIFWYKTLRLQNLCLSVDDIHMEHSFVDDIHGTVVQDQKNVFTLGFTQKIIHVVKDVLHDGMSTSSTLLTITDKIGRSICYYKHKSRGFVQLTEIVGRFFIAGGSRLPETFEVGEHYVVFAFDNGNNIIVYHYLALEDDVERKIIFTRPLNQGNDFIQGESISVSLSVLCKVGTGDTNQVTAYFLVTNNGKTIIITCELGISSTLPKDLSERCRVQIVPLAANNYNTILSDNVGLSCLERICWFAISNTGNLVMLDSNGHLIDLKIPLLCPELRNENHDLHFEITCCNNFLFIRKSGEPIALLSRCLFSSNTFQFIDLTPFKKILASMKHSALFIDILPLDDPFEFPCFFVIDSTHRCSIYKCDITFATFKCVASVSLDMNRKNFDILINMHYFEDYIILQFGDNTFYSIGLEVKPCLAHQRNSDKSTLSMKLNRLKKELLYVNCPNQTNSKFVSVHEQYFTLLGHLLKADENRTLNLTFDDFLCLLRDKSISKILLGIYETQLGICYDKFSSGVESEKSHKAYHYIPCKAILSCKIESNLTQAENTSQQTADNLFSQDVVNPGMSRVLDTLPKIRFDQNFLDFFCQSKTLDVSTDDKKLYYLFIKTIKTKNISGFYKFYFLKELILEEFVLSNSVTNINQVSCAIKNFGASVFMKHTSSSDTKINKTNDNLTAINLKNWKAKYFFTEKDTLLVLMSKQSEALAKVFTEKGKSVLCLWTHVKMFNIGFWVPSSMTLRIIEKIAQTELSHSSTKDPFTVVLFYSVLRKEKLLSGLFRLKKKQRVADLLKLDFTKESVQKIAVKNAFALLKKKNIVAAAAFFILGRNFVQAVTILFQYEKDLQLAVLIGKAITETFSTEIPKYFINDIIENVFLTHIQTDESFILAPLLFICSEHCPQDKKQHYLSRLHGVIKTDAELVDIFFQCFPAATLPKCKQDLVKMTSSKMKLLCSKALPIAAMSLIPADALKTGSFKKDIISVAVCFMMKCVHGTISKNSAVLSVRLHRIKLYNKKCSKAQKVNHIVNYLNSEMNEFLTAFNIVSLKRQIMVALKLVYKRARAYFKLFLITTLLNSTKLTTDDQFLATQEYDILYPLLTQIQTYGRLFVHSKLDWSFERSGLDFLPCARNILHSSLILLKLFPLLSTHAAVASSTTGRKPVTKTSFSTSEIKNTINLGIFYSSWAFQQLSMLNVILLDDDAASKKDVRSVLKSMLYNWLDYEETLLWTDSKELNIPIRHEQSHVIRKADNDAFLRNLINCLAVVGYSEKLHDLKLKTPLTLLHLCQLGVIQNVPLENIKDILSDQRKATSFQSPYLRNIWQILHGAEQLYILKAVTKLKERSRIEAALITSSLPPYEGYHESKTITVFKHKSNGTGLPDLIYSATIVGGLETTKDMLVFSAEKEGMQVLEVSQFETSVHFDSFDHFNGVLYHPDETIRSSNSEKLETSSVDLNVQPSLSKFKDGGSMFLAEKLWHNMLTQVGWPNRFPIKLKPDFLELKYTKTKAKYSDSTTNWKKYKHEFVVEGNTKFRAYFSAGVDEIISLWNVTKTNSSNIGTSLLCRYERDSELSTQHSYCTSLNVNKSGTHFVYTNSVGVLSLYDIERPNSAVLTINAQSKRTLDATFIGDRFMLASCGQGKNTLCIFDSLLPTRNAKVAGINLNEVLPNAQSSSSADVTAYSLCHNESVQCLLIGCGSGNLTVFDLRMRKIRQVVRKAHAKAIRCLRNDNNHWKVAASGSTDGTIKVWSYEHSSEIIEVKHLLGMHPTHHFMNLINTEGMVSQRGVTNIKFTDLNMYSCGADGTVKKTPKF